MLDLHERWPVVDLDADVLIAPHHGADNASCKGFIDAVSPDYVVFSAGRRHGHPRKSAADRYLDFGLPPERLLRTDRGDHEQGRPEWDHLRVEGCQDGSLDDSVEVVLRDDGTVSVSYLQPHDPNDLRCEEVD